MLKKTYSRKAMSLISVVGMIALGGFTLWTVSGSINAPQVIEVNEEISTPADEVLTVNQETSFAKPPKPCLLCVVNEWCSCTYHGSPRISCDPCCYDTRHGIVCID